MSRANRILGILENYNLRDKNGPQRTIQGNTVLLFLEIKKIKASDKLNTSRNPVGGHAGAGVF